MKPVCFHPTAEDEVDDAAAYYESEKPGLGQRFRHELEAALERIMHNPQLYAITIGECRACPLRRFPYTVFYAELDEHIWVAAVAHQSRRPGYWGRRRPD